MPLGLGLFGDLFGGPVFGGPAPAPGVFRPPLPPPPGPLRGPVPTLPPDPYEKSHTKGNDATLIFDPERSAKVNFCDRQVVGSPQFGYWLSCSQ